MAMDLLGMSILELFKGMQQKLSLATTYALADQMVIFVDIFR